jgi:hypothetical protein
MIADTSGRSSKFASYADDEIQNRVKEQIEVLDQHDMHDVPQKW